jgi:deoxyribodipyrimidine photo-lyase
MQSGTTGTNIPRIYNPIKQGRDQDPEGNFIRRWVPELADLSTPCVHEPWLAEVRPAYPAPLVDHVQAARDAKAAISAIRRDPAHAGPARAIVAKHGSRKAGLPDTSRRRKAAAVNNQGQLDL